MLSSLPFWSLAGLAALLCALIYHPNRYNHLGWYAGYLAGGLGCLSMGLALIKLLGWLVVGVRRWWSAAPSGLLEGPGFYGLLALLLALWAALTACAIRRECRRLNNLV